MLSSLGIGEIGWGWDVMGKEEAIERGGIKKLE